MKKKMALILTAALSVSLLAGCGSTAAGDTAAASSSAAPAAATSAAASASQAAASAAAEASASVAATSAAAASSDAGTGKTSGDTFTVGFDAEFPPYGYMGDDGEYTGFDLDLAQEVCDRNGWKLVKQPIDWDAKDAEINSGTIDCIWNGFTMNGREDQYTFTKPYIDNSQVFVVPSDGTIADQAALAGKNVGVQKDSSALAALEGDSKDLAATFGSLTQYADYNTAFMDLQAGAIDAVAIDIGVAKYEISQKGGDGFKILDDYLSTEQYAVGFKLGNTALRDQVQKTLDEMAADGTIQKIAEDKKYADFGIAQSLCIK
jgi:polar amino acid transport system substrate-binding protein